MHLEVFGEEGVGGGGGVVWLPWFRTLLIPAFNELPRIHLLLVMHLFSSYLLGLNNSTFWLHSGCGR